jgi:hypothetical protein
MALITKLTDDIVIRRRAGEETRSGRLLEFFAVTYSGHDDIGTECHTRDEAVRKARELAEARGVSVWYEHDSSATGDLIATFRLP